jgi:iron complex outermembrane receptor protein
LAFPIFHFILTNLSLHMIRHLQIPRVVSQAARLVLTALVLLARPHAAAAREDVLARHVTLQLEGQTVKTVLATIESQVHTHFLYSQQLIGAGRKVSVAAVDEPLSNVLETLLAPLQIKYEVVNSGILLAPAAADPVAVSGRVLDAAGLPMAGATVLEQGTNNGTGTDGDGRFALNVQPDATLVISAIGFKSQQIRLTAAPRLTCGWWPAPPT